MTKVISLPVSEI